MELLKYHFVAPSGYSYDIREQNGQDEEILSNQFDAKNLMNLTKFIAGIVVHTDFTESGKLLVNDVLKLPLLDRYCILINSRIFSLGPELTFSYQWSKDDVVTYEQDLNEFVFDYSEIPSEEELKAKPDAIPFYPCGKSVKEPHEFSTTSGKLIRWQHINGEGEIFLLNLPETQRTRNSELLARKLEFFVEGNWEKVTNFSLFSMKDMAEIRKEILSNDPIFAGLTPIENPITREVTKYPIMAAPSFFYLTED